MIENDNKFDMKINFIYHIPQPLSIENNHISPSLSPVHSVFFRIAKSTEPPSRWRRSSSVSPRSRAAAAARARAAAAIASRSRSPRRIRRRRRPSSSTRPRPLN